MIAPRLIGSEGRPALGALGLERLADARRLESLEVHRRGDDLHIAARVAGAR